MSRREKTRLLSIRIPQSVSARLASVSKKRRTTVSAVVREALEAVTKDPAPSAWAMGAHIFGQPGVVAPKDLSTNKKYLRNLGK